MNGAEALAQGLRSAGLDTVFANPGTSEMHLVGALAAVPGMRLVPGLFEGVLSGAADAHARLTGRPAGLLLHLGPGLANATANLHNASRAGSPVVSIVGEHRSSLLPFDPPLASDIEAIARPYAGWVRRLERPEEAAEAARAAVAAALGTPARHAVLIVPADVAWGEAGRPDTGGDAPAARVDPVPDARIELMADMLRTGGHASALLLGGGLLDGRGSLLAGRIAAATGCRVLSETFPTAQRRGAGLPYLERLPYFPADVLQTLDGVRSLVLAGAREPVAFFGYPGRPDRLVPEGCGVDRLCGPGEDGHAALEALAGLLGAGSSDPVLLPEQRPLRPEGRLTVDAVGQAIGSLLPENAIVVDEAITSGAPCYRFTVQAPTHDWLSLTGGSLGFGLPAALGAAMAAPGRKVLALVGDGSALYTNQALWSLARTGADVVVVVFANRAYRILQLEYANMGLGSPAPAAQDLMRLDTPDLDFVSLARGFGILAARADEAGEFTRILERALAEPGPFLIETVV
ncbi:acetolactate synthase large subunit [Rhodospirillum centenum]|uniref:Thiamine pyrophosphate enzyme, putative n=1 Tax=Rhodospirillum centenum (strain ATCC 51521 / SW) TaxID=414684 RepID=B6ITF4_RHOCS|nr:acetolactate synthase large subunit [Rhodospirillum centenum]ACI99172.1 thiamine pyrophosphate enzyme, putative [Rhodospirillum centenum SW]